VTERSLKIFLMGRKSGLVVSELNSLIRDLGFKYHPMLNGYGIKVMLGLITSSNPGSSIPVIEKNENKGGQMGHIQKICLEKYIFSR